MRRAAIPLVAAVVGMALACGQQKVEGSLQEILDLTYQDIKLRFAGDQIAVRWTRPAQPEGGSGEDAVLEVSEKLDGLTVKTGDSVDLAASLPDFAEVPDGGALPDGGIAPQQRGVVTRDVFADPRKTFPLIADGFMILYDVPRDGGTVNGSFSVTFQRCVDFGCGRTVFGDFKAKVQ